MKQLKLSLTKDTAKEIINFVKVVKNIKPLHRFLEFEIKENKIKFYTEAFGYEFFKKHK